MRNTPCFLADDPFDDPPQLADLIPDASPAPQFEHVSAAAAAAAAGSGMTHVYWRMVGRDQQLQLPP